jgi:hypothetical protein
LVTGLTVDDQGKVSFYGPTSALHDPAQEDTPASAASTSASRFAKSETRSSLASHARESAAWETFALRNASLQTGIPQDIMSKLLHVHWTWVAPMFMWVYRPAFARKSFPRAYSISTV